MTSLPEVKLFRDRDAAVLVWLCEQCAGFDLQNDVAEYNFRGDEALIDCDPSIIILSLRASMSPRLRCASPQKPQPLQHLLYAWGERSRPCLDPWELPHGDAIDDIRAVEGDKHSGESKRKMWREATATDGRGRRLTITLDCRRRTRRALIHDGECLPNRPHVVAIRVMAS